MLDIQGIMSLLPHRYPFLLVDRVLELEPPSAALGRQECQRQRAVLHAATGPGMPIMPGVLIVESLAQAAGILIAASIETRAPRSR